MQHSMLLESQLPKKEKTNYSWDLRLGNCLTELKGLRENSVHLVLTDPPYFLDGLDANWNVEKVEDKASKAGVVGGLPVGMKFCPEAGKELHTFMAAVSKEISRVLVPGGFFLCFSQPRLVHRMAMGIEDAGFEIQDQIAWRYTKKSQFKAFSQDHFVRRKKIPEEEKQRIIQSLGGRRTPQLKPQFESIVLAQNPRIGTFVENWSAFQAGLIDASKLLHGKVPSTVMTVEKPVRESFNSHLTVKPTDLLQYLIEVFSTEDQTVLDPFAGSGTTLMAAKSLSRHSIGIEINSEYFQIAKRRLEKE